MILAFMLIIGLSSSTPKAMELTDLHALSLVSDRVISGSISICSARNADNSTCLEVLSAENMALIEVSPIFQKMDLEKIPLSGSVFVTLNPFDQRSMSLTLWPTPPVVAELSINLEELQAIARSQGERIRSSLAACNQEVQKSIDMLSTSNLNEGVNRLYKMRPLSQEALNCLALSIESERQIGAESFRPPWPNFEDVHHHDYRTVGDMVLAILPMLTGSVIGNPPSVLSAEKRRDSMYAWLIWSQLQLTKENPGSQSARGPA